MSVLDPRTRRVTSSTSLIRFSATALPLSFKVTSDPRRPLLGSWYPTSRYSEARSRKKNPKVRAPQRRLASSALPYCRCSPSHFNMSGVTGSQPGQGKRDPWRVHQEIWVSQRQVHAAYGGKSQFDGARCFGFIGGTVDQEVDDQLFLLTAIGRNISDWVFTPSFAEE